MSILIFSCNIFLTHPMYTRFVLAAILNKYCYSFLVPRYKSMSDNVVVTDTIIINII